MSDELEKISHAFDEDFYQIAVNELKSGQFSQALWSKALAKSSFDEAKAKGVYVDLRVEQLKGDIVLQRASVEAAAEVAAMEEENKKLEEELVKLKTEAVVQNVLLSPLLLIQILILASAAGFHQKSWLIFGAVIVVLLILMVTPVVSSLVGFLLVGLFGYAGYLFGSELWGESGGYWTGGIAALIVLGANSELLEKNKKIRSM